MLLCCFLCSVSVKDDCKLAKSVEGVSQQWSCDLVVHLCESNLSDNHSNVMSFLLLVLSYQKLWQRRCAGAPRRTFWARPRATLTSLLHFMTLLLVETTHSASPKVNLSLNLEGGKLNNLFRWFILSYKLSHCHNLWFHKNFILSVHHR